MSGTNTERGPKDLVEEKKGDECKEGGIRRFQRVLCIFPLRIFSVGEERGYSKPGPSKLMRFHPFPPPPPIPNLHSSTQKSSRFGKQGGGGILR